MRERLGRWLYHHPFSISWFGVAFCAVFLVWDLHDHNWIAAAGISAAAGLNLWIIWRGRKRMRETDAIIAEMERRSAETLERMRAERAAGYKRNPEDL
jgi:membrane protein implicated in regulation of membrane protease activity